MTEVSLCREVLVTKSFFSMTYKLLALVVLVGLFSIKSTHLFGQHNDPVPQKPTTVSKEREFWEETNRTLSVTAIDSSTTKVSKQVALFEGVKMQIQTSKNQLKTVRRWSLIQDKLIVVFTDSEKITFSLTALANYKKITLFVEIGETKTQRQIYTSNNLSKLTLKI